MISVETPRTKETPRVETNGRSPREASESGSRTSAVIVVRMSVRPAADAASHAAEIRNSGGPTSRGGGSLMPHVRSAASAPPAPADVSGSSRALVPQATGCSVLEAGGQS